MAAAAVGKEPPSSCLAAVSFVGSLLGKSCKVGELQKGFRGLRVLRGFGAKRGLGG